MATPKKKKTGEGLYKKRFATLKEHRAAVAARKALKGGKNVGPVANADAYGSAIKPKTTPKAATPKTTPKKSTPKPTTGRTSSQSRTADHSRPNQTKNGASLGSKLSAEEKAKREKAASPASMAAANKDKKPKFVSGRNRLAMHLDEKNKNRGSDPKNETRVRYVRTPGGGRTKVYEIKRNGKWVKAGGKG